jgi:hypothetical protein
VCAPYNDTEMQTHEFDSPGGLEETKHRLARASRHPLHVDLSTEYDERSDGPESAEGLRSMSPKHVVWNNRSDTPAYVGSGRYNLIQHREVLDAVQEALQGTGAEVEKGMVRDRGEHVDGVLVFAGGDARIDVEDLVDGYVPPEGEWPFGMKDRLGLGMRFHNSFDGRSGFGGSTMAYRFICGNWMVWGEETIAERSDYHIKSAGDRPGVDPGYFEEVIGAVFERKEMVQDVVMESAVDEFPVEWAPGLLKRAGFGGGYARDITARLLHSGHDETATLWDLYNMATSYLDNERAGDLGPERYDHHQGSAWAVLEGGVEEPEYQPEEDVAEYARVVA